MSEIPDYSEIPYLQEILRYLPIDPIDEEDVINYIQNITNLIAVNYKYGQYQFAYFGIHLLLMTYTYCTAWKISQIEPDRYKDAIVFARSYAGRENDLKIEDAESIFSYSLIPEKDIAKIFRIIGLDKSQVKRIKDLVCDRDYMVHATGQFEIVTEEIFDAKVKNVLLAFSGIHKCMQAQIRKWYSEILLSFCAGKYDAYDDPKDFIVEQMIQNFKLSVNELLVCNEMSVNTLITQHREYQEKLKNFKKSMALYCEDMDYLSE